MKTNFYIYTSGELCRKDNSIVHIKGDIKTYIPIEQLRDLYVFGEINLNKRVLSLLSNYNVSIIFFNYYGNIIGRYLPKKYKVGKYIVEQVNSFQNLKVRLYISKQIIEASMHNMLNIIKYYNRKYACFESESEQFNDLIGAIDNISSNEKLLLLEARSKQLYYSCFDSIIRNAIIKFVKRSKRPPENEVNAMMSFLYSLLYSNILTVIDTSFLLPEISYIHSINKHKASLHFDIADIFKPVIVDRLIFRLIKRNQIFKHHFEYKDNNRCYLNKEGLNLITDEYNNVLRNTIFVRESNRYYSYNQLLSREISNLSNYIIGNAKEYIPFKMRG